MSFLKNLLILAVSTLIALIAVEVAIRRELVPMPAYVNTTGWWKETWFRTRQGPIPQEFVKVDTDLGWVPAPDLRDHKLGRVGVSTNAAGMRGLRDYPQARTGAPRVVVLGDSYAFGQCAEDEETFPQQLEGLLPGSEVLNLGGMGYGHDQMLLRWRRDGAPYQPDVVVLGFKKMDISRNRLAFRDYGKPRFRIDDDDLVVTNVPVPTPDDYDAALWPPRLANYAGIFWDSYFWDDAYAEANRLTNWILRQTAREVAEADARFLLLYLPRREDLRKNEPYPAYPMKRTCEKVEGILCASAVARFREALEGQDPRPHFGCHYSPLLYRLVAEEIAAALRRELPEVFGAL